MFLFKMYVHGNGNGYDLTKRMQLGGNFQTAWIMFDHAKHVEGGLHSLAMCMILSIIKSSRL